MTNPIARQTRPHLSVVIPVYKAENCLKELYSRLKASLSSIHEDFEIILVEDCGGDQSWSIIQELCRLDPRVKGLQFSRNFGQHFGITAGLDYCEGDWVVVMDCDLQDAPEDIPRLYKKAQEGFACVVANRKRRKDRWQKRLQSWVFYRVFSYLAGMNYDGKAGNFRIISRDLVLYLRQMREQLRLFGGMIDWLGFPKAIIEVEHQARFAGESSYTWAKLIRLASDSIVAYSDKPLKMSVTLGLTLSVTAFFVGIFHWMRSFHLGVQISGWSALIISLYFLSGVIIGILGILGLYLGKVFEQSKQRPLYVINKKSNFSDRA